MRSKTGFYKSNTQRVSALALALGLGFSAAMPAQAEQGATTDKNWNEKKIGIMAGASAAGAVLGGPVGFVLGAAVGDWLGDGVNKGDQVANMTAERDQALAELARVQDQLVIAQLEASRYQDMALDSLQLQVMFRTAEDTVKPRSHAQLDALARLLNEKPQLQVYLTGSADPRGDKTYNQALSERRAGSVQDYLTGKGIAADRINSSAHGAQYSEASKNDLDAYAMERVVTIELREAQEGLAAR